MTRKRMLRRTAGTVLLLLSLGLTNCQAFFSTGFSGWGVIVSEVSNRA